MPTFIDFFSTFKNDLLEFAKEKFDEYRKALLQDVNSFSEKS